MTAMQKKKQFDILFENDFLIAINKPSGFLCTPDRHDPEAITIRQLLIESYGYLWNVHRLDLETSGVLLFARDAETHRNFSMAFEHHDVKKVYHAIIRGIPAWKINTCELPLMPDGDKFHRTIIDAGKGKRSKTVFQLLDSWHGYSLIEALPETGRTHQIRVHLASLGFPVICDDLYGSKEPVFLSKIKRGWKGDIYSERPLLSRLALHAVSVEFPGILINRNSDQPNDENMKIEAPYPADFRAFFNQLSRI